MLTDAIILVVEDDHNLNKTISDIFKFKGYTVFSVSSGIEALNLIKKENPAVVLLDLNLEDINGIDILKEFKKSFSHMECIVITGHATKESAIEAINLGAYGYIQKPYEPEQLLLMVRRAVEKIKTDKLLNDHRKKLQIAHDRISSLIQEVIKEKKFDIRFENPHLKKCYEVMICNKEDCPCYGKERERCWQIDGTCGGGKEYGSFDDKYNSCSACPVYREATVDPVYQLGESFNNMMYILELKNKELEKAYTDLKDSQFRIVQQEKMASIGQIAAGVAHEINNPIGFISGNLRALDKYINKFTDFINIQNGIISSFNNEEAKKIITEKRKNFKLDYVCEDVKGLIAESLDGTERVSSIVKGLKSFSRTDDEKYACSDINVCMENSLRIVWNELKYKATVTKDYGTLPVTKCYYNQLSQVFINLLVNAGHAIQEKGEITVKTWNDNNTVYISVADTGCGIPAENIHKLFDPFFTTKEAGKGTGLGLSISYDIVKKHGGDISVDTVSGKGTTFTVKIPFVED